MKQLFAALILGLSLMTGCTKGSTAEAAASSGTVEVDESLLSVEITLPKDFVGDDVTQESLNEKIEDGIKSITLNEDGSVTYVMTKGKHKEMLAQMRQATLESNEDMLKEGTFPQILEIKANEDLTHFTVKTSCTNESEMDLNTSFSVLGFYLEGGFYNAFKGDKDVNIIVDFTDENGNVISTGESENLKD